MVWRQNRESQKHEGADQHSAVGAILAEANDDVVALQCLLRVFQKGNESLLGAFGKKTAGHANVERAAPYQCFPLDRGVLGQVKGEE